MLCKNMVILVRNNSRVLVMIRFIIYFFALYILNIDKKIALQSHDSGARYLLK